MNRGAALAALALFVGCSGNGSMWRTTPCLDTATALAPPPKCFPTPTLDADAGVAARRFDPHLFDRVAVLGASVSAGFSAPRVAVSLQAALPASAITDAADRFMFRDADARGRVQVDAALAARPTLVVAIDFLFWYAYQPGDRAASLERGLAQLDRLDDATTTLAVGDLADMRGADPRMLVPELVPTVDELAAMNARIVAWAGPRRHTVVLPLAAWTAPLRAGGSVELAPGESIVADHLLFLDRLHPNPLGLWYLLTRVDGALEASVAVPAATLVLARP